MKIMEKLTALKELQIEKTTENGDIAYTSTGNNLIDLLFMAEYFQHHLDEVHIGTSDKEKVFAMYMRDARFGKGYRDLGRKLMELTGNTPEEIVTAGRFDDLYRILNEENLNYLFKEVKAGNQLAKKWMPRMTGKDSTIAKLFAQAMGISYKEYRKLIQVNNTVEYKLSYAVPKANTDDKLSKAFIESGYDTEEQSNYDHPLVDEIDFEKVPSLAMTKYYGAFSRREDTKDRFAEYLENVKNNKAKVNTATTTVRDAHRMVTKADASLGENADILGKKIVEDNTKGLNLNAICVFDSSASMTWGHEHNGNTPYENAIAVAHAVATNSSYAKNQVISFSSRPRLINIKGATLKEQYQSMYTGDCSNTDLGKVFDILTQLKEYPEYLIILSDMEFDCGSNFKYQAWSEKMRATGAKTKLIWWNFNQRNRTSPETDKFGNIYMSGYDVTSLMLLPGVISMDEYIDNLLNDYIKNIH